MTSQLRQAIYLLLTLCMIFFVGCGPDSAEKEGNDISVRINEFKLNPIDVSDGANVAAEWNVSHSSPSGLYTFEVHITSDTRTVSDLTRIFSVNCPLHASCRNDGGGVQACTFVRPQAGSGGTFTCSGTSPGTKTVSQTGILFAVGRACIFDQTATSICDSKSLEIKLG